jgi:hypothetical protein
MTTNPKDVYAAVKDRLKLLGLNSYDYIPGAAEWPGAFVLMGEVEHEGLADDWITIRFEILLMVSAAIDEHQLQLLDYQAFSGPKSISEAFRTEPTLGLDGANVRIVRSRPLGYEEQAGYQGFGCTFEAVARLG